MNLQLCPVAEVDNAWPQISNGMEQACIRGGGDLDAPYLFQECRSGRALLFVIADGPTINASLIGRVETWAGTRVFHIFAACGKGMLVWIDAIREHELWPAHLNCEKVVFAGREGWKRMIPKARVIRQVYEVDMNDG